jgi:hypothetical protein
MGMAERDLCASVRLINLVHSLNKEFHPFARRGLKAFAEQRQVPEGLHV